MKKNTPLPEINVKDLRKELNLTQQEFSEKYHLELETVRNWEQGKHSPGVAAKMLIFLIKNIPLDIDTALEKHGFI